MGITFGGRDLIFISRSLIVIAWPGQFSQRRSNFWLVVLLANGKKALSSESRQVLVSSQARHSSACNRDERFANLADHDEFSWLTDDGEWNFHGVSSVTAGKNCNPLLGLHGPEVPSGPVVNFSITLLPGDARASWKAAAKKASLSHAENVLHIHLVHLLLEALDILCHGHPIHILSFSMKLDGVEARAFGGVLQPTSSPSSPTFSVARRSSLHDLRLSRRSP